MKRYFISTNEMENKLKGVILAGGKGTRLWPITKSISKSLLPVFDKPMIYYPLSTLMLCGIKEYLIISTIEDIHQYERLLRDGKQWGISFEYRIQEKPRGIAEAISIAEDFIDGQNFSLILGDNFIYGVGMGRHLISNVKKNEATIATFMVRNPSEYGVIEFDNQGLAVNLIEKPKEFVSNWAVIGIYFLTAEAVNYVKEIQPSDRGELEIVDVLKEYLKRGTLNVLKLPRGITWLDLGNSENLLEAGEFVRTLQNRHDLLIGSPEETALKMGYLKKLDMNEQINVENSYFNALRNLERNQDT
jgi:glucose-1-phosphate thymidylyltransferase